MPWWKRRAKAESVHVAYVKDKDKWEPFYWPICQCGWSGEQRTEQPGAEEAAFAEAREHAAVHAEVLAIAVVPEVVYPIDGR